MNIKAAIRVDASVEIGTGHLMRCLTLAGQLARMNASVRFITTELPGNLRSFLSGKGYAVDYLPASRSPSFDWEGDARNTALLIRNDAPDYVIVDHYSLDARWESVIRPWCRKIMVIDDLADRRHECDVLLDQNLKQNMQERYDKLVSAHCMKLLGPQFALLREDFIEARRHLRERDGSVRRIMISFGGSDPSNETAKALGAIQRLDQSAMAVDVVVGSSNPHRRNIEALCNSLPNTKYYCQIDTMAQLMAEADLFIGAGGSTTWERCYLGLPSITLILAQNQQELTEAVASAGATVNLGWSGHVGAPDLASAIRSLMNNRGTLVSLSKKALQVMGNPTDRKNIPALLFSVLDGKYYA